MKMTALIKPIPPKRILVVDDEMPVAETIRLILSLNGHAVEIANDAPTALTLFKDRKHDLVITDLSMPGMDGLDLAREVRQLRATQPIIMITASAPMMTAEGKAVPNIDLLIAKPFSLSQIRDALERIFPG